MGDEYRSEMVKRVGLPSLCANIFMIWISRRVMMFGWSDLSWDIDFLFDIAGGGIKHSY